MSQISDHEDFLLRYMIDIENEPFTSPQRSPEMIAHRFLLSGIEITTDHAMRLQWNLYKRDFLDKHTTPEGARFKISSKAKRFCSRNSIAP